MSPTGVPYIALDDGEKAVYRGAGWHIVRFSENRLVALFNPLDVSLAPLPQMVESAKQGALAFMREPGDYWLVMCSGYDLCEPRRLTPHDPVSYARMVRMFGEALKEV